MDHNLVGELMALKEMGVKPNYSALQKEYGVDRHTIKKYYENGGKTYRRRPPVPSKCDPYRKEIEDSLAAPGVSIMAVWQYMAATHVGVPRGKAAEIHPRFEAGPGEQLQFGWVEDLSMTLRSGEVAGFNVFSATFAHSRFHRSVYSHSRTTEDLLRCLIDVLRPAGGTTSRMLTDDMAAIVSITNGSRRKHPKILAFERDLGVRMRLCGPRSPETKGKVESANRFAKWLEPYQGKPAGLDGLIGALAAVEAACNAAPNRTASIPPIALWGKEKELLRPVPSAALMESYLDGSSVQTVPPTLLASFRGRSYSVPARFAGRRVACYPVDGGLYIYCGSSLAARHEISERPINCRDRDCLEAMAASCGSGADIESASAENLRLLAGLGAK
jgi:transposase